MPDLSKYIDIFLSEAEENIQKLNTNLLSLENMFKHGENEATLKKLLNDLMRASHTIKGSSASMGFLKTAYMTHVMEDVFDGLRNDKLILNNDIINVVFGLIDNLDRSVKSIKETGQELDFSDQVNQLKTMTGVNTVGVGKSVRSEKPAENTNAAAAPFAEPAEPSQAENQATPKPESVSKPAEANTQEIEAVTKLEYIKVPIGRLDELLDLVEELLIDKMKLEQLSYKHTELKEIYAHMHLLISSIQYQVMQSRLVPVEQVFTRFPRMIRDLSQKLDKQVEFIISGGDIELDRTIVDKLGEPLIHLLRNAVDHGVGKQGVIKLEASRKSNYVLISVENDGNSLNLEKIKQIALKKGLITPQRAETMHDTEIEELIFDSSLSTKDEVTDVSGRGVGLSVVKNFTNMLSGRVMVENVNPGVKFTLELPLTLAIINSLLVEVDREIFAIPFSNIERSIILPNQDIKRMADNEVAVVDGIKVPIIRLNNFFSLSKYNQIKAEFEQRKANDGLAANKNNISLGIPEESTQLRGDNLLVVLVRKEEETIGIVVDNLINEEEIIVKPLSPVLRQVKGFSGSTILGDGRAVLILDVMNLIVEQAD